MLLISKKVIKRKRNNKKGGFKDKRKRKKEKEEDEKRNEFEIQREIAKKVYVAEAMVLSVNRTFFSLRDASGL